MNVSIDKCIEDIFNHTKEARRILVEKNNLTYIDGNCHENVIKLSRYLYNNTDYEPYIRWGVVDYHNKNYTDLKNAEHDGVVHFWCEIPISENNWIYADLFSMNSVADDITRGDVFVSDELPETYLQLDNTLFKYHPRIKTGHLVSYKDYFLLQDMLGVEFVD